ncbi:TPA: hypothetical protein NKU90_000411 [Vibrio parahaemolyticus]|uniref:hypothetical protein n=1 Tax=Vibrio TaxID=662 RepID=UPI00040CCA39|nr:MULTISPECIES: hypothetical protein [Vibrio]GAK14824.1 hypothetical protein JCM19053_4695 [Vibrio sp. JCM 19053]ANB97619.1 hypothetical protein FORC14_1022 [Vibrio parahaemolyticus]EHH1259587.1 hypothetical protein [Vibrio parahaemolyticus]EIE5865665.1 hypothetical protein [Vibrio alginolyticus]EJA7355653.1 hypothetical protein [Vibrio parahaemolyticus]
MSQLAIQQEQLQQAPNANESIAACKALFNGSATRSKLKELWDGMPPRFRGMVLIAGDLKASEHVREFDSFNDLELHKIRNGMQQIKEIATLFDRNVGDVRRLKHYQFSNTH